MPTVAHDKLIAIGEALLKGAGCSDYEAQCVAKGCVGANLAGHDMAAFDAVVKESANHMVVDGN